MTKPLTPGCMALIIQGTPCPCPECSTNNGAVVTLLRHVPAYEPVHLDHGLTVSYGTPSWVCEGQLHLPTTAGLIPFSYLPFPASRLVRIDNPDGQDETLTWTPVPTGVTA